MKKHLTVALTLFLLWLPVISHALPPAIIWEAIKPRLTETSTISIPVGTPHTQIISHQAPRLMPYELSAEWLPEGASLNVHTGEFSFTPAADQVGKYELVFSITQGEVQATQTVLLEVVSLAPTPHTVEPVRFVISNSWFLMDPPYEAKLFLNNVEQSELNLDVSQSFSLRSWNGVEEPATYTVMVKPENATGWWEYPNLPLGYIFTPETGQLRYMANMQVQINHMVRLVAQTEHEQSETTFMLQVQDMIPKIKPHHWKENTGIVNTYRLPSINQMLGLSDEDYLDYRFYYSAVTNTDEVAATHPNKQPLTFEVGNFIYYPDETPSTEDFFHFSLLDPSHSGYLTKQPLEMTSTFPNPRPEGDIREASVIVYDDEGNHDGRMLIFSLVKAPAEWRDYQTEYEVAVGESVTMVVEASDPDGLSFDIQIEDITSDPALPNLVETFSTAFAASTTFENNVVTKTITFTPNELSQVGEYQLKPVMNAHGFTPVPITLRVINPYYSEVQDVLETTLTADSAEGLVQKLQDLTPGNAATLEADGSISLTTASGIGLSLDASTYDNELLAEKILQYWAANGISLGEETNLKDPSQLQTIERLYTDFVNSSNYDSSLENGTLSFQPKRKIFNTEGESISSRYVKVVAPLEKYGLGSKEAMEVRHIFENASSDFVVSSVVNDQANLEFFRKELRDKEGIAAMHIVSKGVTYYNIPYLVTGQVFNKLDKNFDDSFIGGLTGGALVLHMDNVEAMAHFALSSILDALTLADRIAAQFGEAQDVVALLTQVHKAPTKVLITKILDLLKMPNAYETIQGIANIELRDAPAAHYAISPEFLSHYYGGDQAAGMPTITVGSFGFSSKVNGFGQVFLDRSTKVFLGHESQAPSGYVGTGVIGYWEELLKNRGNTHEAKATLPTDGPLKVYEDEDNLNLRLLGGTDHLDNQIAFVENLSSGNLLIEPAFGQIIDWKVDAENNYMSKLVSKDQFNTSETDTMLLLGTWHDPEYLKKNYGSDLQAKLDGHAFPLEEDDEVYYSAEDVLIPAGGKVGITFSYRLAKVHPSHSTPEGRCHTADFDFEFFVNKQQLLEEHISGTSTGSFPHSNEFLIATSMKDAVLNVSEFIGEKVDLTFKFTLNPTDSSTLPEPSCRYNGYVLVKDLKIVVTPERGERWKLVDEMEQRCNASFTSANAKKRACQPSDGAKYVAHHIAEANITLSPAPNSRKILEKYNVSLNSADNGVYLRATNAGDQDRAYRDTLDTQCYRDHVYACLKTATSESSVKAKLGQIADALLEDNFPFDESDARCTYSVASCPL